MLGTFLPSDGDHDRAVGFLGSLVAADLVPDGVERLYFRPDGTLLTDVDLETTYALIEVKTGDTVKLKQGHLHLDDRTVNPKNKPVILYAPEYSRVQRLAYERIETTVVGTVDEFLDAIRRFKSIVRDSTERSYEK